MKYLRLLLLFILTFISLEAKTVYFDGEDSSTQAWLNRDNSVIQNIYNQELDSRVVNLSPGTYDIGLGGRSWDNRTERILSWNMNITGAYTIYVRVNTIEGHRWLFYNHLNVDVGFHGSGILNGIGWRTNNGTWQKVTVDLDRDLQDTEPNNRIISVEGMRFGGTLGMIDNITLDTPHRTVYEDGENGTTHCRITDDTPAGASVTLIAEDSDNDETRENVISLNGHNEDNAFTIGAEEGVNSWNNQDEHVLQWKMRNSEHFRVIVYVQTVQGNKRLIYTPIRRDNGISTDNLEIHHGLGISRDGDGTSYGLGTDGRWQTYTRDLEDDLRDYDPTNRLIAVNGIAIRGNTLIDDIELLSSVEPHLSIENQESVYEDAEDSTTNDWRVRQGEQSDIRNIFDPTLRSRVIQLTGGGSYILGAINGENAWHNTTQKMISWRMRTDTPYAIYVIVHTTNGLRHLFYTSSPNRGLLHGFESGIHHGLGTSTINGRWKRVTRDLERDLKDAEPENEIISVDGFIYNGGNNGMIDDIVLYNADETLYENGEEGINKWRVSDNTPPDTSIRNIADNDRQGRHLQGNVISLNGAGYDNAYMIGDVNSENGWNDRDKKILQWRFRNFGPEVEIINPRGIIRDPNAFEFRVSIDTANGTRDLIYTLGADNLGLIENGHTIHHGLGDDRIRGSVWLEDNPMNELGLWQTITRDLEEDIRDFEPNNRLIAVNGFQVRNSGLIDDIKILSNSTHSDRDENSMVYEDAEDSNIDGWRIFANGSGNATITNIMDNDKNSRVISLQGVGKQDAYRFRSADNHNWNDREHTNMQWSMNFGEDFTIYISVQTTNGQRYLTYTPRDDNRGLRGNYILIGLGENSDNGIWQTFTRDLQADISIAEENNELISIDSIIIRGSGRFDDIVAF